METKKFDKKRLLVVMLPAIALLSFYFLYSFGDGEFTSGEFEDSSTVAIVTPDVEREEINSKTDIYDREIDKNIEKDEQQKRATNFDEMMMNPSEQKDPFEDSKKELTEKFNSNELPEEPELEEEVISTPKKKITSNSGIKKTFKANSINQTQKTEAIQPIVATNSNERTGFYSSFKKSDKYKQVNELTGFINAIVQADHKIRNGQTVNIRILEDCIIGGHEIPANTYCNGIATFGNERCFINISAIRVGESIFSVNVFVYDQDGNKGIYVPGGVNQEINKDAVNSGNELQTTISIPMVGGVTTNAASKKLNDQSINIPKGYKLLLKEISNSSGY